MPYDPKYKIGDGFDIANNIPKSCPFYLDYIHQDTPKTLEG